MSAYYRRQQLYQLSTATTAQGGARVWFVHDLISLWRICTNNIIIHIQDCLPLYLSKAELRGLIEIN